MPRLAALAFALLIPMPAMSEDAPGPLARLSEAMLAAAMAFPEEIAHLRRALPRWQIAPGRAEALPLPETPAADHWLGAIRLTAFPGGGPLHLTCRRMGAGLMEPPGTQPGPTFAAMAKEAAHLPTAYVAIQRCTGTLDLPASAPMRARITADFRNLAEDFTAAGYDPAIAAPKENAPLAAQLSGHGPVCRWGDCVTALALDLRENAGSITLTMRVDSAKEP